MAELDTVGNVQKEEPGVEEETFACEGLQETQVEEVELLAEDAQVAEDIACIVERVKKQEVPCVPPERQHEVSVSNACDLASWVVACDATQLGSFMEEKYLLYCVSAEQDAEVPEAEKHARWARESYYLHLQEYRKSVESRSVVLEALAPLFREGFLTEAIKGNLVALTSSLDSSQMDVVLRGIERAWQQVWCSIPSVARVSEVEMKKNWFSQLYGVVFLGMVIIIDWCE